MKLKVIAIFAFIAILLPIFLVDFYLKIRTKTVSKPFSETKQVLPKLNSAKFDPSVIGWIPYWDQNKAFASFRKNVGLFDYISLFWYRLDESGSILTYETAFEDQATINFAHENGVKVLAVVANLPDYTEGGDWDWRRVDGVIKSPETRKIHVSDLLALVNDKGFDGVAIDYEALQGKQRNNFSLFIEELSTTFHRSDKIVGVAIHPKTSENDPEEKNGSQAQDLKRLSDAADQLYFMTYGEHDATTSPGPVGSLDWMDKVYSFAIDELGVKSQKAFVGLPLYGYDWSDSGEASSLEYDRIEGLLQETNSRVKWNQNEGEPSFYYSKNGMGHQVWFNNAKSVKSKLDFVKQFYVGGVSFWRLGAEDDEVWDVVRTY
jgi:spore germination protein YaaH